MEFIEAPAFTRYLSDYLGDDEYRALQKQLGLGPDAGDLMPGTGGFRKIRWADKGVVRDGEGAPARDLLSLCGGSSDLADDVVWQE